MREPVSYDFGIDIFLHAKKRKSDDGNSKRENREELLTLVH
jgi:hypothetical protein